MKKVSQILIFAGFMLLTVASLNSGFSRNAFAANPASHAEKRREPAFSLYLKSVFFGSRLPASEKPRNQMFVLALLGAAAMTMIQKFLGTEIPPLLGSLWSVLYAACFLVYGFWVLNLLSSLPSGWTFSSITKGIGVLASAVAFLILMDHRSRTRKALAPGYRKCPHCGEAIVVLAVECSACRRKV